MVYLYLLIAILTEVAATSALKSSEEFTRLLPSLIVVVGYVVSFYSLALVLRDLPIGITYAVWSGVGVVLITMIGVVLYKEIPDLPAIIGMGMIIAGVSVIHLFSRGMSSTF